MDGYCIKCVCYIAIVLVFVFVLVLAIPSSSFAPSFILLRHSMGLFGGRFPLFPSLSLIMA